jgi:8-oxo-dGTP pyrophosphatase MutT (NUDIX family)|tara:strand:- start:15 stop:410 length:396 start_codon:yes stop_codon:yes gene_type:complete
VGKSQGRNLGGSVVLVLDRTNQLLILKRPNWVSWAPGKWGLPGGKIEEGEAPKEAAVRETKEETTLAVHNLKNVTLPLDKGLHPFYTRSYTGQVVIDEEHEEWVWVTRQEIEKYDLAPNILPMYDWVLKHG